LRSWDRLCRVQLLRQAGLISGTLPPRIAARVQSLTGDASGTAARAAAAPPQRVDSSASPGGPAASAPAAAPAAAPHKPQQLQAQQPVPLQPRRQPLQAGPPAQPREAATPSWQPAGEDIAPETPERAAPPAQASTPGSALSPAEQARLAGWILLPRTLRAL